MSAYLGISAYYHDSAAAIVIDGEIIAAAQEERFNRRKHSAVFPTKAVQYCLEEANLSFDHLDGVVFYDKPFLKFERLMETYKQSAPNGLISFVLAMPVWIREKLFLKRRIRKGMKKAGMKNWKRTKLYFTEHHLSHAASTFYPSSFEDAAILTIDGVGEWATATISKGSGNEIEILKEMHFPHSVGLFYSAFTYFLGFKVNSGEYKMMGLAPYGDPNSAQSANFKSSIKKELLTVYDDGSIYLNQKYFRYMTSSRMIREAKWEDLFGLKRRNENDDLNQVHCNLALAVQQLTEEIVLKMATEAKRITGSNYLCIAGGVGLNAICNYKLRSKGIFNDIWVQPASGDAGGALGAALCADRLFNPKSTATISDMKGALLGPHFSIKEVRTSFEQSEIAFSEMEEEELVIQIAAELKAGKIIGWFQGRMEFGPRALGNRSILADPSIEGIQDKLNQMIKKRESFRPFAPITTREGAEKYFELNKSDYMLEIAPLKSEWREDLPEDYMEKSLSDRLATKRSPFQATTHVDFSSRLQTVSEESNAKLYRLLKKFEELGSAPILLNTSFNERGEPIVCTPEDAYDCFLRTGIDILVIGNIMVVRN